MILICYDHAMDLTVPCSCPDSTKIPVMLTSLTIDYGIFEGIGIRIEGRVPSREWEEYHRRRKISIREVGPKRLTEGKKLLPSGE